MKEYKLADEALRVTRKRVLMRLPMVLVLVTAIFCIMLYPMRYDEDLLWEILPLIAFAMVLGTGIGFYFILRYTATFLNSFKLTVNEDTIVRELKFFPTIKLKFDEIKTITFNKMGVIIITGHDKKKAIAVTQYVENREEFITILETIMPLSPARENRFHQILWFIPAALMIASIYVHEWAENETIQIISGMIPGSIISIGCVYVAFNKRVDKRIRTIAKVFLVIMALGILSTIVLKKLSAN